MTKHKTPYHILRLQSISPEIVLSGKCELCDIRGRIDNLNMKLLAEGYIRKASEDGVFGPLCEITDKGREYLESYYEWQKNPTF